MTKEHKQLVLVAILAITLYAVWPSGRKGQQDTVDIATAQLSASTASAGPNSEVTTAKHSALIGSLASDETDDSPTPAQTFRQRWSIEEILKMELIGRSPSKSAASPKSEAIPADTLQTTPVQAVYFTSSSRQADSPSNANASAIVSGRIVKPGQSLPGNRIIGEIHPHGIAIQSID